MFKSKILILVFAVFLIAQPNSALSGIPDLSHSEAFIAYDGPGTPSLLVVPDGSGNSFTQAHDEQGNVVDATITLYVRDNFDVPIAHYPFEDMWLETTDGGLIICMGGASANQNTDVQGMTQWVYPLFAGGNSPGPVRVSISGSVLPEELPLKFNSPDFNGDLAVNMDDVTILADDYFTGYSFRCDLNGDGVLNLQDIPIFAENYGVNCP